MTLGGEKGKCIHDGQRKESACFPDKKNPPFGKGGSHKMPGADKGWEGKDLINLI